MGRLRSLLRNLKRDARGELESFVLEDGSRYYYDRLETYRQLFLHAYDLQLGRGGRSPEPPEIYHKMCEAKDPAAVLEQFKPENPQTALVNMAELYDTDVLIRERRLVPLTHTPVEDLSE